MVQWLRHYAFTAEGPGSIPGQVTRILQAAGCGQKKKNRNLNVQQEGIGSTNDNIWKQGLHIVEKRANVSTILNGKSIFQNNINSITFVLMHL